jgi:hypothetical protein
METNNMNIRAKFEEIWPVHNYDGIYWSPRDGKYLSAGHLSDSLADEYNARLDTFTRCQENMAIPEITKEQVFFALCCHIEDPSDDEEEGFNAGVSWCLAFIKQEIAKRNRK